MDEPTNNPATPLIYECDCKCGELITTDEYLGEPYRCDPCDRCYGYDWSDWRVSDIPHPALYESAPTFQQRENRGDVQASTYEKGNHS